jgi:hypothetical protein
VLALSTCLRGLLLSPHPVHLVASSLSS